MSAGIAYPWAEPPAPGAAIEVAPGVLWMRLPLSMKLDHVNVYALDEGDGWTVVDTGFDSAKSRAIWQMLLDGPLAGKPVTRVIAPHHHPDHLGLAGMRERVESLGGNFRVESAPGQGTRVIADLSLAGEEEAI